MRSLRAATSLLGIGLLAGCGIGTDVERIDAFRATLTGAEEVPPVTTIATGVADFVLETPTQLVYQLRVDDIEDATAAHIHFGAPGVNGPVVVLLFQAEDPVSVAAPTTIATGTITAGDVNAVTGFDGSFASLLAEMRAGNMYVNVHTTENPPGEIRGRIVELF